jgi:NDP-sugar pyrophosphorylase family protein
MDANGRIKALRPTQDSNLWINGGFFIFRSGIFNYLREGEELVEAPFKRLVEADQLLAFKHEGFWRPMDTLKDKEVLDNLVELGTTPWRLSARPQQLCQASGAEWDQVNKAGKLGSAAETSCACAEV